MTPEEIQEKIIKEIDDNFVAIATSLQDIDKAYEVTNECILKIVERLKNLEEYVVQIPTPDKILYKPKKKDDYLNFKENLDFLYTRIEKLENHIFGDTE